MLVEVSSLIEKVRKDVQNGTKEHNIADYIDIGVGSIINNLLFGYRFEGVIFYTIRKCFFIYSVSKCKRRWN